MNQEQDTNSEFSQRHNYASTRGQERHERRMAKEAARAQRRAARAQRPHQDWTFEFKADDKVYTFNWHWHQPVVGHQETEETGNAGSETENGPNTPEVS
jgi:hypothetical protein